MGRQRMSQADWEAKEAVRAEREAASLLGCSERQRKAIAAVYAQRRYARQHNRRVRQAQWDLEAAQRGASTQGDAEGDLDQSPHWRAYWEARPDAYARYLAQKYADLV